MDDRKLLFMRRFGTQMNCPPTSGLAPGRVDEPAGMSVLGRFST
jgi:hypothetical protein